MLPKIENRPDFEKLCSQLFGMEGESYQSRLYELLLKYDGSFLFTTTYKDILEPLINVYFRRRLVNFIRENKSLYQNAHEPDVKEDAKEEDFDTAMEHLAEGKGWGGRREIVAASHFLKIKIIVLEKASKTQYSVVCQHNNYLLREWISKGEGYSDTLYLVCTCPAHLHDHYRCLIATQYLKGVQLSLFSMISDDTLNIVGDEVEDKKSVVMKEKLRIAHCYFTQGQLEKALEAYRTFIQPMHEKSADDLYASVYPRLGCCYYMRSIHDKNTKDREEAKYFFEQGTKHYSIAKNHLIYGQFLYLEGKKQKNDVLLKEAIVLLRRVKELHDTESSANYTELEKMFLPLPLQKKLSPGKVLTFNAALLAEYHLIQSYSELKMDLGRAVHHFKKMVSQHVSPVGYVLLADICKAIGDIKDVDGYLKQSQALEDLVQGYQNKDWAKQVKSLSSMAECYLNRQKYAAAAKLYNGALVLLSKVTEETKEEIRILKKLKRVEWRFLEEQFDMKHNRVRVREENFDEIRLRNKEALKAIRQQVEEQLDLMDKNPTEYKEFLMDFIIQQGGKEEFQALKDEKTSIQDWKAWIIQWLFKLIAYKINRFLHAMLQDCIQLISQLIHKDPPCDYALLSTGSLSREEITPYSDLELVILIQDKQDEKLNEENSIYFKRLSQLFELRVINLGETSLTKEQHFLPKVTTLSGELENIPSPIKIGFSLDVHKNPATRQSLILTPNKLADYQKSEHFIHEPNNHLSSSLLNVAYVTGSPNGRGLLKEYWQEIRKIYGLYGFPDEKSPNVPTLRITRSALLMTEVADMFGPKMSTEFEGANLKVKPDLYRLPQALMDVLALYFDLSSHSTWDRIDDLYKKSILTQKAARHLKWALSYATELRLKIYAFNKAQIEDFDVIRFWGKDSSEIKEHSAYLLHNQDHVDALKEIYKILIPLHQACKDFFSEIEKNSRYYGELLNSKKMLFLCVCIVALMNKWIPTNSISLTGLSLIYILYALTRNPSPVTSIVMTLYLASNLFSPNYNFFIGASLSSILLTLPQFRPLHYMNLQNSFKNNSLYDETPTTLLIIEQRLGFFREAETRCRTNLELTRCVNTEAVNLLLLGKILAQTGKVEQALHYHQQLLYKLEAEDPQSIILCNIACNYLQLGECQKALEYVQHAFATSRNSEDRIHCTEKLGIVYIRMGSLERPYDGCNML